MIQNRNCGHNLLLVCGKIVLLMAFFVPLYLDTIWYIRRLVETSNLDCVMEIGCGTGQIIESAAQLWYKQYQNQTIEWIGLDINPNFIAHCSKNSTKGMVNYHV